ncbi:uncharacterized protein N7482_003180 [Penicillium canariense]|uniref:Uncharacterized protein n=1 Tax=Penicillium canariense TaxID=189055 RepID=A0A9W9I475_9EURO|nr:uncharacterized protein N7482_003180 [Penicillium canariense]KAJ5167586.1 hypothetical protein N7482_003180 [Penicillium canariense]
MDKDTDDKILPSASATQVSPQTTPTKEPLLGHDSEIDNRKSLRDAHRTKQIQTLRIVQSMLSALLSLAIAIFQGKVYWTYQNTKSNAGAWPSVPNVVPTLLMFSVALAALVFDGSMLVAYIAPGSKFSRWAIMVGGAAHYIVTSSKTVGYTISSIISMTSLNYGNVSGTHTDLWSYTCTDQPANMDSLIQASSNCNTQWASWGFAIGQLFIEVIGWVISALALRQSEKKLSEQAVDERFTAYSADINGQLKDVTPQFAFNS